MELNREQYEKIQECFPKQRKPAKISNLEVLNAVLYIVENGCKWRRLPKEYGDWHVIYVRVNRWAQKGAKGVFALTATRDHSNPSKHSEPGFHLYQSTSRRNGRFEKSGPQSIGRTRGGWNTIIWLPHLNGMG